MDFELTDTQRDLAAGAAELAQQFSLEYWLEHDNSGDYPSEFVRAFADGGWLGLFVPEEYGGQGMGLIEAALLLREVAASGAGMSGASAIHFYVFPGAPIIRYGSDELKGRVLPALARGELLTAFAVTEPNAGSDTSRIETRAERHGDRWVINGQKVWMTNAQNASKMLLLTRTEPRKPERPFDGMTLFFADLDRDHCTVRKIDKLGRACIDSNEVFIADLTADDGDVVGEVGRGFYHLLDGFNAERLVLAMECVGIGQAALRIATKYATERVVFDRPIGANQSIAHPLAAAWTHLLAAELLALKGAWLYDAGRSCDREANASKYLAAEAGYSACDAALQTLGGFGYAKEYHVERLWREARLYKIAPISQQLVLSALAHHALDLPRSF